MLDADARIADRDPALPGLRLLLDDAALGAWLGSRLGAGMTVDVDYVRYKPGTSCVVGGAVRGLPGSRRLVVTTYAADAAPKLVKTVDRARPGTLVAVDAASNTVATTPEADRDLPGVAALAGADRGALLDDLLGGSHGSGLPSTGTVLSHRPGRRWVALVHGPDGAPRGVVRAYRPQVLAQAHRAHAALAGGRPRTAGLLGSSTRLGLLGLEWVAGKTLDSGGGTDLPAVGRLLARLHQRPADLGAVSARDEAAAVRSSARQVALLLPDLADDVLAVAGRVARELNRVPTDVASLHGDFSADQVVAAPDGRLVLLDLDRAARGPAALDLGSWVAAAVLADGPGAGPGAGDARLPAGLPSGLAAGLAAGYASVRPLPGDDALAASVAAQLLRRAPEPFRRRMPGWPDRTRSLVTAAGAALGLEVAA